MNLTDQLGALESSLDELILAAASTPAADSPVASSPAADVAATTAPDPAPTADEKPTLNVSRPEKNVIEMTIGGKTVALSPEGVSQLIEELSNARASMTVDQPNGLPPGWRYVATKNPVMATQRYPNGDRLLVLRHTGHGWVPFSFSPDMVIELYAMLTQR
ncbi:MULTISPECIES: hypothetical protein [Burkholderiaceae]|jgi:hypothetical protein|uniref:Putative tail fiber protein n=1 Tax=Caballeronia sordidicola TaxID=196367 RepID=A0A242N1P4_CABSO|nr:MULTISPECIES: hypothetical protein [Burkholderiaceae]AME26038.1 hypothetical protein AXG89_19140 [Burkholderia sp. PAMC 26561]OTP77600.1 putative tail fiber protein [Caballeronia sordidicola]